MATGTAIRRRGSAHRSKQQQWQQRQYRTQDDSVPILSLERTDRPRPDTIEEQFFIAGHSAARSLAAKVSIMAPAPASVALWLIHVIGTLQQTLC